MLLFVCFFIINWMSSDTEWLVRTSARYKQLFFQSKEKGVFFFLFQGAVSFTSEVRGEYISTLYSQTGGPVSYSESKWTLASYLEQGHGTQKVVFHWSEHWAGWTSLLKTFWCVHSLNKPSDVKWVKTSCLQVKHCVQSKR